MRTDAIIIPYSAYCTYARYWPKCFVHITCYVTTALCKLDTIIPISHVRKPSHNKIKQFFQGHIARRHCHRMITSRFLKENVF